MCMCVFAHTRICVCGYVGDHAIQTHTHTTHTRTVTDTRSSPYASRNAFTVYSTHSLNETVSVCIRDSHTHTDEHTQAAHEHMYANTHIRTHTRTKHAHTPPNPHLRPYTHTHTHTHAHTHTHTYAHTIFTQYTRPHAHTYTHSYVHTHRSWRFLSFRKCVIE